MWCLFLAFLCAVGVTVVFAIAIALFVYLSEKLVDWFGYNAPLWLIALMFVIVLTICFAHDNKCFG